LRSRSDSKQTCGPMAGSLLPCWLAFPLHFPIAHRPGWRNGRRSGLKIRRGNPWGFESPSRYPHDDKTRGNSRVLLASGPWAQGISSISGARHYGRAEPPGPCQEPTPGTLRFGPGCGVSGSDRIRTGFQRRSHETQRRGPLCLLLKSRNRHAAAPTGSTVVGLTYNSPHIPRKSAPCDIRHNRSAANPPSCDGPPGRQGHR
jgi:hypothetical protein